MLDRKHLQRTTLQLAMVCLCLLMGQAFAGTVTVFGPKLYVRGKGQPVTQRDSFAVSFVCAGGNIVSCSAPVIVSSDGAGQVVTGTAGNGAGQSASTTVHLNIDRTLPAITATSNPVPNAQGWNNTYVSVSFSCSDS